MSVTTQADVYLDSVKGNISSAIDHLSRVVVEECDGHDEFKPEYRAELLAIHAELLRIRLRLRCEL